MKNETMDSALSVFAREFDGFTPSKTKGLMSRETEDGVLLLIGYQQSRTNLVFYLNFGAYFCGIKAVAKTPKIPDWHLYARFERFSQMPVHEYNKLFSTEVAAADSLPSRCAEIAAFAKAHIIPGLVGFGDFKLLRDRLAKSGPKVFDPYWAQGITKAEIARHVQGAE